MMNKTKEIVDLFNRKAVQYQQKYMEVEGYEAGFDLFCAGVEEVNATVLEMACGPGNISRYLLNRRPDFSILGTDLSENMIALAKVNNPQAEFVKMDMRAVGQLQRKFGGVLCGFGLPYLSKTEAVELMATVSALLNPGGMLYLSTMEGTEAHTGYIGPSEEGGERLYTYYHQADYLQAALEEHGFSLVAQSRQANAPQSGGTGFDLILIAKKTGI